MDAIVIGVAPLTVVRLDESGSRRCNVPAGAPVPETADLADVARLIKEGYLAIVESPDEDEPVVTEPVVTEPVVTEPVVTEPVVTEPVVTEPVVTEPVVTEPVVTEPVVTEPVVVEAGPVDVAQLLKGSVDEVLDAVGDDADLAAMVLAAEQATSRPRKGVLEGLQEAIDAAAEGEQ